MQRYTVELVSPDGTPEPLPGTYTAVDVRNIRRAKKQAQRTSFLALGATVYPWALFDSIRATPCTQAAA